MCRNTSQYEKSAKVEEPFVLVVDFETRVWKLKIFSADEPAR